MNCGEKIIELQILTDNICAVARKEMSPLKMKVLFLVHEYGVITPKLLISKIGIAKSNLAAICKILQKEEMIVAEKSIKNARQIKYSLTSRGASVIKEIISNINSVFRNSEQTSQMEFAFKISADILNKKV